MKITVKKFGGTSLKNTARIDYIARHLIENRQEDEGLIIVVSAMGNKTDELHTLAKKISPNPSLRELDMLLTAGERISMSLLALALQKYGGNSISFTGSQSGIITSTNHGNAKIIDVKSFRIKEELEKGKIVIVAGFQGVSKLKEVTTLGRGGSDTTATALACYLNADKCEIYTDVDGVFSSDPNLFEDAILYPEISYEKLIIQATSGAKVIHPRAVEFAQNYKINLEIRNSFNMHKKGTIVKQVINEKQTVNSLASLKNLYRFIIEIDNYENFGKILNKVQEMNILQHELNNNRLIIFSHEKELLQDFLTFNKIPHTVISNVIALTITGYKISNNNKLLLNIIKNLEKDCAIISYNHTVSYIRIFFTLQKKELNKILKKLNKQFTKGSL